MTGDLGTRAALPGGCGDAVVAFVVRMVAAGVAAVFLWLLTDVAVRGAPGLSWEFLTAPPEAAGREGGIGPILVSTLLVLGVCLGAAVPVGVATALFCSEFARRGGRVAALVRGSLDVLAAVPSIVFGLFGNAFFSVFLGLGFSILSGGLTLACMVLPILIRTIEIGLAGVPDDVRRAGAALALSRTTLARRVLLPAAAPALVAGLVLGVGRALAETAALIFTSGYVSRTPRSLLDSGRTISVHIYDLSMNVAGGDANAAASALVLVGVLVGVQTLAHSLAGRAARRAR